jgi:hypothetical protein
MRRPLSILLILFFGLGPLAATLSASDESRLPSCCRRHGTHHCAMSARMAAEMADSTSGKPILTAPATCPYFPGYTVAPTTTILALAPAPVALPVLLANPHSAACARAAARLSQIRTRAGRAPPASSLA